LECRGHFETCHPAHRSAAELEAIVKLSEQPLNIGNGVQCPLCAETLRSVQQYQSHVGRHQEDLALFALPSLEADRGPDGDGQDKLETGSESTAAPTLTELGERPRALEKEVRDEPDVSPSHYPPEIDDDGQAHHSLTYHEEDENAGSTIENQRPASGEENKTLEQDQTRGTSAMGDAAAIDDWFLEGLGSASDVQYGQYPEVSANQRYWPLQESLASSRISADATTSDLPFVCQWEGCTNAYPRQCDLDKHIKNHTKRRRCDICGAGGAETKDLNRHMWAHHTEVARERGLLKEEDRCGMCGYWARKDNLKRHKDYHGHW